MSTDNTLELVKYEFKTEKGTIEISFEDTIESPKFKIKGPKEIVHQAIGGIGFETEDGTETIATEVHLDTEAKRMYAMLEVLKLVK